MSSVEVQGERLSPAKSNGKTSSAAKKERSNEH